jgi:PAS domain S-box-containing protein
MVIEKRPACPSPFITTGWSRQAEAPLSAHGETLTESGPGKHSFAGLKTVGLYVSLGIAWVCFSSSLLGRPVHGPSLFTYLPFLQDILFIVFTAGFFFFVMNRQKRRFMLANSRAVQDVLRCSETHLAQARKALQESEEKLRSIIENSTDGIYLFDEKGLIIEWNTGLEQITLLPRDQAVGRPLWEVYYEFLPDEAKRPEMMELFKKSILENIREENRPRTMLDLVIQRPDKTRRVIQSSDFPVTTAWRKMRSVITRDITERQQAEEERSRLIAALEQAHEIIMIGDRDGRIQYVNASFERILGLSRDEVMGIPQSAFAQTQESLDMHQKAFEALARGTVWSGVIHVKNKNRSKIPFEVVTSPIRNVQGAVTSFVSIARDISRELLMEEQLRQAQKMEAIGTLAGGIAHDFNNILAAIMGYTELAALAAPESSTQKHNLEQVLRAADRARALVKQILAFSRKQEQQRQPLQLQSIIKEAVKLLRATTPTTIEIVSDIRNDQGYVIADPTQMHQVLVNLCTNGVHAMQKSGGRLEIGFVSVELAETDMAIFPDLHPGQYVKLTVKDTGTGIEPAIMDRIFDPFFTTKEVDKGTGMGLAVVHGIVKSHGGAITVDSRLGAGTVFTILLPRAAEGIAREQAAGVSLPRGTACILFVDDEKILVRLGCGMLASLGYRAVPAQGSLEALALFQKDPSRFDLVITDQTMPQMTGVEFTRQLREIRPDIPIILCTGYSEAVDAAKAEELSIQAFVMKPVRLREIAETLRKVLDKGISEETT